MGGFEAVQMMLVFAKAVAATREFGFWLHWGEVGRWGGVDRKEG